MVIGGAKGSGFTTRILVAVSVPHIFSIMYIIVSMPAVRPVITPFVTLVCAFVFVHVPPETVSTSVIDPLTHILLCPVMLPANGNGLIVIGLDAVSAPQMFVTVYLMVSVPADKPKTTPFWMVSATLLLIQIPPLIVSASVIEDPTHTGQTSDVACEW